ncbi:NAD-dependent glycerol-3-phosphate dehydrogenase [Neoconidiobolus thromboides FSU 785]|nr:NAD-dependent glycerol-3-phosphate dehydrogenase [Neoconidiobolus thromboides FSU 785]
MNKVLIVGSGNWGSTTAKIIGNNALKLNNVENEVRMWVFEEMVDGKKLTEIINTQNENVKYLPGIKLPKNVVAYPNLEEAVVGCNVLVFVTPHQFIESICEQIKGKLPKDCKAISLVKGVHVDSKGITLISNYISKELGIEVSTLSGANIADEIAIERFSETTIGYVNEQDGKFYFDLFNTPYFRVSIVPDVHGVEMCGALKNIVAIAAGIIDGMELGPNTKAAIIRIGLMEMKKFAQVYLEGVKENTFFESSGVGDLITTCYGGRNRKVAEAHVRTGKSFEELEKELLNGQKLQGTITSKEVNQFLSARNQEDEFPLFTKVYRICYKGLPPSEIVEGL